MVTTASTGRVEELQYSALNFRREQSDQRTLILTMNNRKSTGKIVTTLDFVNKASQTSPVMCGT